jgi:hypothetical protein
MKQDSIVRFISENKKIIVLCESDTALGDLHDYLVMLKGSIVDRMVKAQKEDVESAEGHKELENNEGNEGKEA